MPYPHIPHACPAQSILPDQAFHFISVTNILGHSILSIRSIPVVYALINNIRATVGNRKRFNANDDLHPPRTHHRTIKNAPPARQTARLFRHVSRSTYRYMKPLSKASDSENATEPATRFFSVHPLPEGPSAFRKSETRLRHLR